MTDRILHLGPVFAAALLVSCGSREGESRLISTAMERQTIEQNARVVVEVMSEDLGAPFDLDGKSVEVLDEYIEKHRATFDDSTREELISLFGSFLGETIIKTYGGDWKYNPEFGWGVDIRARVTVFPFNTTRNHFELGEEDSIAALFALIPSLIQTAEARAGMNQPSDQTPSSTTAGPAVPLTLTTTRKGSILTLGSTNDTPATNPAPAP
jgi:hypothetical protein